MKTHNKKGVLYPLLHRFFGSLTVTLPKENGLCFLQECARKKLLYWDMKKTEDGFSVRLSPSFAEAFLGFAEEFGIRATVQSKQGLPFLLKKYKLRAGLLVGLFLGMALLFFSELFIWKITVEGNSVMTDGQIVDSLSEYGVRVGSFIPKIPILKAQNEFLLHNKDLSSVALNVRGTHLDVRVLERTHAPEKEDTFGFCNVVASEDGIVRYVEATEGSAMVHPGDVVFKGQLLVSSYTVDGRNLYYPHHARAKVQADVYATHAVTVPLTRSEKIFTGNTEKCVRITVLGKEFFPHGSEISRFDDYEASAKTKTVFLFGWIETPITVTKVLYREYARIENSLSYEQAKEEALTELEQWSALQTDGIVSVETETAYDEIQNACILNASVVFRKNIATDRMLSPGEGPPEDLKPPVIVPH